MKKLISIFAMVLLSQMVKGQMELDSTKKWFYLDTAQYKYLPKKDFISEYFGITESGGEKIFVGTVELTEEYLIVPIEIKKLKEYTQSFDTLYTKVDESQWKQDLGYMNLYATISFPVKEPNYFYFIISGKRK